MTSPIRVLMVCTGNICRSPTAQAVLAQGAERRGWGADLVVDSAGIVSDHLGQAPDPRAVRHAAQRGVDLSRLRARQVSPSDFEQQDWILALDRGHLRQLQRMAPLHARPQMRLLMTFAAKGGPDDVPDPYWGGPEAFEQALDLIEGACQGFLDFLARQPRGPGARGRAAG